MEQGDSLERILELLRRGLTGCAVELADEPAEGALCRELPGGRLLVVRPGEGGPAEEEVAARLDSLLGLFEHTLSTVSGEPTAPPRSPPSRSLRRELEALVERSGAEDALVIDAGSPIIWCSAVAGGPIRGDNGQLLKLTPRLREAIVLLNRSRGELIELVRRELEVAPGERACAANAEPPEDEDPPLPGRSRRVVEALRSRPELDARRSGGRSRLLGLENDLGYLAHGFADIYLLVLVFDGAFDELRAERAASFALPVIERLVVALPPFDPEPAAPGRAISLRRR